MSAQEIAKKPAVQPATPDDSSAGAGNEKAIFGFWVYLMTDCVLFATLFATFAVLRNNTFGGPSAHELFSLSFVLAETIILLTSSFTVGLGVLAAQQQAKKQVLLWFGITFCLGLAFLGLELKEFTHLYNEGNSWRRSGFLSAFFTLVGTHGAHITAGLLWMGILLLKVLRLDLTAVNIKRLTMLAMFWHFLDIVWIFIFTIVYLFGVSSL
jgi:cytochrome o ubiquinol oxidase subunit 3